MYSRFHQWWWTRPIGIQVHTCNLTKPKDNHVASNNMHSTENWWLQAFCISSTDYYASCNFNVSIKLLCSNTNTVRMMHDDHELCKQVSSVCMTYVHAKCSSVWWIALLVQCCRAFLNDNSAHVCDKRDSNLKLNEGRKYQDLQAITHSMRPGLMQCGSVHLLIADVGMKCLQHVEILTSHASMLWFTHCSLLKSAVQAFVSTYTGCVMVHDTFIWNKESSAWWHMSLDAAL